MKKMIYVVGAAILNDDQDQILVAKRDSDRVLHDMWEFPGGKIEARETPQEAIRREIKEELNVDIVVGDQVGPTTEYEYDFGTVRLTVFFAKLLTHDFELVAHSKMKWVNKKELLDLTWPAADEEIVDELKDKSLKDVTFGE